MTINFFFLTFIADTLKNEEERVEQLAPWIVQTEVELLKQKKLHPISRNALIIIKRLRLTTGLFILYRFIVQLICSLEQPKTDL